MVKSARCCFRAQDLIKEGIEFTASPTALTLWQNSIILPISVMYFTRVHREQITEAWERPHSMPHVSATQTEITLHV